MELLTQLLDKMSKSGNGGSFECTLGKRKHPIPQSANLKVSDARQGNPKGMPCPYFITGQGI